MTVAPRSISEWPASDRIASEPVKRPTTAFAAVSPADAAIDTSAAFSFSFMFASAPKGGADHVDTMILTAGFRPGIVPVRAAVPAASAAERECCQGLARVLPDAVAAPTHIRADGEVAEWLKAAVC